MGIVPCWKYKNGTNLIDPVFSTFMGLLSAIAGPMIFLSVAWGIYSIGDTATLGKIGKKMILRIILMSFVLTILAGGILFPFFPISAGGESSFDFGGLFQMVLDIVPNNLFTPFIEGNPLQIIFVAVLIGLSLLILESKTTMVAGAVEQFNYVVQLLIDGVSSFVPFVVFCSILKMVLQNNMQIFLKAAKLFPLLLLGLITVILSIAAPPVPGGALTCFTMLFIQLQIPEEAVAIMITLNMFLEFMATAVNLFCLQAELVELAGSLNMLDVERLRQK